MSGRREERGVIRVCAPGFPLLFFKLNLTSRRGLWHANWVRPPLPPFPANPNPIRFYVKSACPALLYETPS